MTPKRAGAPEDAAVIEKRFPIHSSEWRRNPFLPRSVPWSLVEGHEAQAQVNHYQSLERLAERGGLSICELWAVCTDRRFNGSGPREREICLNWLWRRLNG